MVEDFAEVLAKSNTRDLRQNESVLIRKIRVIRVLFLHAMNLSLTMNE